jgi:hypothetical protein
MIAMSITLVFCLFVISFIFCKDENFKNMPKILWFPYSIIVVIPGAIWTMSCIFLIPLFGIAAGIHDIYDGNTKGWILIGIDLYGFICAFILAKFNHI